MVWHWQHLQCPRVGCFVSNSWEQIIQLSCLQCRRPPQSTLQVSAALAGLRATWAPWKPETSELWWDGLAKRLWILATLAGQHEMEMFSRILLKAGLCVWLLVLALFPCLFYVSLLPLPSWVKRRPIARTNKQTKIPPWCVFRFIPAATQFCLQPQTGAFSDVLSQNNKIQHRFEWRKQKPQ